jgi:hypothetical protein
MKVFIRSVIWAIAMAMPAVYAQESSPGKTAMETPRRIAKPAAAHVNISPRPTVHPTPRAKVANENTANIKRANYADAVRRYRHEKHDREWWRKHYLVIVLVGGGYYYWDAGYWYPAWGYDSGYQSYDYDGPIYTYSNLLPDQVVINVQNALKELGYYGGNITGSLGASTRQALSAYQQDYGLDVTGAVDEETVRALGLFEG